MRRHNPDALTTREREVLSLVRRGLTNEEIAGRLGITLDGAKYHVSQILSKLGVASREEAAATPAAESFEPRRRWYWKLAWIGGVGVTAVAFAGIGVLVYGVMSTLTEERPPVNVSGLTVEEAYARVRETVSRPSFVLHTTISPTTATAEDRDAEASHPAISRTAELWIDGTSDAFRLHHDLGWRFIIVRDSVYSLSPFDKSGDATKGQTSATNPGFCPRSADWIIGFLLCGGSELAQPPDASFTVRLVPDEVYNGRSAFVLLFERSTQGELALVGPCELEPPPLAPTATPPLVPAESRIISRIYIDPREMLPMARVNEYFHGGTMCDTQVYEYQNEFLRVNDLGEGWLDPNSIGGSVEKAGER